MFAPHIRLPHIRLACALKTLTQHILVNAATCFSRKMAAEWIQAEENFAFVRRLTQFLVCVSISFNCLTAYFILFYSPKHLAGYKYVLLNICVWSISVDLHVAFLFLPMPHLEIVGGYATGILDFLDARGGLEDFSCWFVI
ncbi:hypothetical protein L596_030084 [Steinernema carpocapsae]|uniref:Uncharacterized protein n=1 Tax=Steinernema carpocapsae TaxID=34508 RepID=A0A4U5LRN6_STECR|nr:hypothetical protein L596_030084 [Steinernema carpocapsae]